MENENAVLYWGEFEELANLYRLAELGLARQGWWLEYREPHGQEHAPIDGAANELLEALALRCAAELAHLERVKIRVVGESKRGQICVQRGTVVDWGWLL